MNRGGCSIEIGWACPQAVRGYSDASLRGTDLERRALVRSAKADLDWRVSRALVAELCGDRCHGMLSLSHSAGHAVCACASARVGIDMERRRERDVVRLAQWVCTPAELDDLLRLSSSDRLQHFYVLWTIKEAFVKAANLAFPADMRRIRLEEGKLMPPFGRWAVAVFELDPDWIVAIVIEADEGLQNPECIEWKASRFSSLPERRLLGWWQA